MQFSGKTKNIHGNFFSLNFVHLRYKTVANLLLWVMSQILMQNCLFTVDQIGFLPSMLIVIKVNSINSNWYSDQCLTCKY